MSNLPASSLAYLPQNTVILQIVNNVKSNTGVGYTVQLDITIDGVPNTLTALPGVSTRYSLGSCPTEVRTVAERWFDSKGRVVGGRDYSNVDVNSFPAGRFGCGNTLMWELTETSVNTEIF